MLFNIVADIPLLHITMVILSDSLIENLLTLPKLDVQMCEFSALIFPPGAERTEAWGQRSLLLDLKGNDLWLWRDPSPDEKQSV